MSIDIDVQMLDVQGFTDANSQLSTVYCAGSLRHSGTGSASSHPSSQIRDSVEANGEGRNSPSVHIERQGLLLFPLRSDPVVANLRFGTTGPDWLAPTSQCRTHHLLRRYRYLDPEAEGTKVGVKMFLWDRGDELLKGTC